MKTIAAALLLLGLVACGGGPFAYQDPMLASPDGGAVPEPVGDPPRMVQEGSAPAPPPVGAPDAGPALPPPATPDGGSVPPAPSCDPPTQILPQLCGTSGCHNATDRANGLDLITKGLSQRLIQQPAVGGPGLLVDVYNPGQSIMLAKLHTPPPYGERMPFLSAPLSAADLACMTGWVYGLVGQTP